MAKGRSRYRDRLLGIIVRVKVDGEVVKTEASSERLFSIEMSMEEE